jgi:hypothetical protein
MPHGGNKARRDDNVAAPPGLGRYLAFEPAPGQLRPEDGWIAATIGPLTIQTRKLSIEIRNTVLHYRILTAIICRFAGMHR